MELTPAVAEYLVQRAPRVAFRILPGDDLRGRSALVTQLLELMGGGHLPVLAGYSFSPVCSSTFSKTPSQMVCFSEYRYLVTTDNGVFERYQAHHPRFIASSVASLLERMVARDRAAEVGYSFRIYRRLGSELAALFGCQPTAWPHFWQNSEASIDEGEARTDLDCVSLDGVRRLMAAAERGQWPLVLREDRPPSPCTRPRAQPSLTWSLPAIGGAIVRSGGEWDSPAFLRLELCDDALVQTRFAFGFPVDERVGSVSGVGWSTPRFGSPRLVDYLVRHRASQVLALRTSVGLEQALVDHGFGAYRGALAVAEDQGGLIAAGPLGGHDGLLISPQLMMVEPAPFSGQLPLTVPPSWELMRGNREIEGLAVGCVVSTLTLAVDRNGWLYTEDDAGNEHPEAITATTYLEKLAVEEELHRRCDSPVAIERDLASKLAASLCLERVAEASDEISEVFWVEEPAMMAVERRRYPDLFGSPMGTYLWAETPAALVALVAAARALVPDAAVRRLDWFIPTNERFEVLRQAGFGQLDSNLDDG